MNTMKLRTAAVCALLVLVAPFAGAHPYLQSDYWANFQALAADMPAQLDALMTQYVGCNLWSTNCNSQTAVYTSVVGQNGAGWVGSDHGAVNTPAWAYAAAGMTNDNRFALLEAVLNTGACLDGLSLSNVNLIRNTFAANRDKPMPNVTVTNVRLTGKVNYYISLSIDETISIVTGQNNRLCVDTGIAGTQCFDVDVPSMESLLDDANEKLDDALRNLCAAYMTVGDSRGVLYWQSFMGRLGFTFLNELLPGLLNNIGKSDDGSIYVPTSDPGVALRAALLMGFGQLQLAGDAKSATACAPWGTVQDLDTGELPRIEFDGGYVDNARVRIPGQNVCAAVATWASTYATGVGKYAGLPLLLGSGVAGSNAGDLNGDGTTNLASCQAASGNTTEFLLRESATTPSSLVIATQPAGNYSGTGQGSPECNGSWTFTAAMQYPALAYSFQWLQGTAPGSLSVAATTTAPTRTVALPYGVPTTSCA